MFQTISHRVSMSKVVRAPMMFSHLIVMTTLLMLSPLSLVPIIVSVIFQRKVQLFVLFLLMKRPSSVSLTMFLPVAPALLLKIPHHPQFRVPLQSLSMLLVVRVMQKSVLMFCYLMMMLCCHPIMVVLINFLHSFVMYCVLRRQIYLLF